MRNLIFSIITIFCIINCNKAPIVEDLDNKQNEDFNSFITDFDADSTFQKSRIKFPLKVKIYEYDLENKELTSFDYIKINDWKFEKDLFSKSEKYIINSENIDDSHKNIILQIEDTGIYVAYNFIKINGLWHLVQIEDKST